MSAHLHLDPNSKRLAPLVIENKKATIPSQTPTEEWSKLSWDTKQMFFGGAVTFQSRGTDIKLIFDDLQLSKESVNIFMGKYLAKAKQSPSSVNVCSPIIIKDMLPVKTDENQFVTFFSRRNVSSSVFTYEEDVFLVSGVEQEELALLMKHEAVDKSRNQVRKKALSSRHMVLERDEDFADICKRTDKPIHWLEYRDRGLYWIKSRGSLVAVQAFVNETSEMTEDDLLNQLEKKSHGHVCISSSHGINNFSDVLTSLGAKLKERHPERLIMYASLNDILYKMRSWGGSLEDLITALLEKICTTDLEMELCKLYFTCAEIKVEVILDGFENVEEKDLSMALKYLKMLSSLPALRVSMAVKGYLRNVLENTLHQMSYEMVPYGPKLE